MRPRIGEAIDRLAGLVQDDRLEEERVQLLRLAVEAKLQHVHHRMSGRLLDTKRDDDQGDFARTVRTRAALRCATSSPRCCPSVR